MKWITVLFFALCLFFIPSTVTEAAPPPPGFTEIIDSGPESPCGGNGTAVPGEICHINPDTTDKTVRIGQSTKTCWYVKDKDTGERTEVCLEPGTEVTHTYNIEYRPGGGYTRPDHQWKADMVRNADPKLTNEIIKKATVDFTNEQYESDRGRTCYFDDQGTMVKNEVSETVYIMALKYVQNIVQYPKRFSTYWGLDSRDNQNYEEPTERISKHVRPCGFSVTGAKGPEKEVPSLGRVIFTLFELIQQVLSVGFGDPVKSNAVITNSKRNPKIEEIASKGPGVIAADMELSPIDGAAKYADKPGFIETFRPGLVKYRPPEVNAQVEDNPFIGSFDQNTTNVYLDNLVECGYQHLCQTLWPASNVPEICKYKPEINCGAPTPTPTTSGWNCNTSVSEQASEQTNQAGQDWADNGIFAAGSCPTTENAWKMCHNDVIARAKKACVDPLFALTIWLHESAASNYKCSEQLNNGLEVQDFGDTAVPAENFSAQLDDFLTLNYDCSHTIEDWVSMYYIGNHCFADEPDKTKVTDYVAELQEIYTALGGGTLPSWPKGACSVSL